MQEETQCQTRLSFWNITPSIPRNYQTGIYIYFHVIQKVLHVRQAIHFLDLQTNKVGELGTGRIKSTTHDLSINAKTFRKHVVSLRSGYT